MDGSGTRITLCGRLEVVVAGGGRAAARRGRQGRAVLAYVAWHRPRPVRRHELADVLWRDGAGAPSDTALAPVLSRLPSALAPGKVAGRGGLALELPAPVRVDVEAAWNAVAWASASIGAEALAAAREAAGLVGGGLLPGLEAPWFEAPRATVEDLHVEALELAARVGLLVDPPVAEESARAAIAAAPFRESARAAPVEVLRARGDGAEALQAYEEVRVLLREELGTAPGPELLALHEALLRGDPRAAAAARAQAGELAAGCGARALGDVPAA